MLQTQSFTWKWRHLQDDKIFHRNPCNFSQKSTEFVFMFQRHISCSEYLDFQRLQFHNEQDCCDQENWLYRLQIRCLHIRNHSKCRCQWSQLPEIRHRPLWKTHRGHWQRPHKEQGHTKSVISRPSSQDIHKTIATTKNMILANCLSTLLVGPMPVIVRMKTLFIMTLKEMILRIMRIVLMLNDDELINDLLVHGSSVEVDDHFVFILY